MVDILRTIVQHDYEFVMVVDLSTGRYVKYVGSDAYAHIPEQGDHAVQVRSVAERFVLPEDREEYLEKMSLPVIAAMLESRKKPSFTYRRRKLSGEIAWLKANFIYASEEKRSVIIAYYDDTEEVVARLNERKKIELQDEGIRFMAQNLCEDFLIADLESGACSMVTPDTGNMVAKGTFKEQVDWFAENIVAPEEREAYLHYFNLANLVPHIRKNNGFCTMNCTVIYKDGRHNFVVATTLIRDSIEPEKEYLFAYAQDITRLKQMEYKNKELFLQSRLDPVTGLCNRVATEQDIDEYLHSSQRGEGGSASDSGRRFFQELQRQLRTRGGRRGAGLYGRSHADRFSQRGHPLPLGRRRIFDLYKRIRLTAGGDRADCPPATADEGFFFRGQGLAGQSERRRGSGRTGDARPGRAVSEG